MEGPWFHRLALPRRLVSRGGGGVNRRGFSSSNARYRNRFTPEDECVHMKGRRVGRNDWGFAPRGREVSPSSSSPPSSLRLAVKLGLQDVKSLERRYDRCHQRVLEVLCLQQQEENKEELSTSATSADPPVDLVDAVRLLAACGELDKVRLLTAELRRSHRAHLLSDPFYLALIQGASIALEDHPERLLSLFYDEIPVLSSSGSATSSVTPQALYTELLHALVHWRRRRRRRKEEDDDVVVVEDEALSVLRTVSREFVRLFPVHTLPRASVLALFRAYLHLGDYDTIWRLHAEELVAPEVTDHVDVLDVVLEAMCRHDDLPRASQLRERLTRPLRLSVTSFLSYVRLLVRKGELRAAASLLHDEARHTELLAATSTTTSTTTSSSLRSFRKTLYELVHALTLASEDQLVQKLLRRFDVGGRERSQAARVIGHAMVGRNSLPEALLLLSQNPAGSEREGAELRRGIVAGLLDACDLRRAQLLTDKAIKT